MCNDELFPFDTIIFEDQENIYPRWQSGQANNFIISDPTLNKNAL